MAHTLVTPNVCETRLANHTVLNKTQTGFQAIRRDWAASSRNTLPFS